MRRLVFTVATGHRKYGEMAMGLARSLSLIGDDTPRAVITDIKDQDWKRYFQYVLPPETNLKFPYMQKLDALKRTDADQVIFLDSDSLVFKRLDPIFERCQGHPLLTPGELKNNGEFQGKDLAAFCKENNLQGFPRFSGGFIYYERNPETDRLFQEATRVAETYDQTGFKLFRGQVPDEAALGVAIARTGVGTLISFDSDYSHSGVGMVGRLHMDVAKGECKFLCRSERMRLIEPYVFHAHYYQNFFVYWRQLEALKKLERYEDSTEPGHKTRWTRLRKSIESRILKGRL